MRDGDCSRLGRYAVVHLLGASLGNVAVEIADSWLVRDHYLSSAGSKSCIGCPYSFCAGDSLSPSDGVFLYWSSALASSCWSRWLRFQTDLMIFFINFTVDSAFPLLYG